MESLKATLDSSQVLVEPFSALQTSIAKLQPVRLHTHETVGYVEETNEGDTHETVGYVEETNEGDTHETVGHVEETNESDTHEDEEEEEEDYSHYNTVEFSVPENIKQQREKLKEEVSQDDSSTLFEGLQDDITVEEFDPSSYLKFGWTNKVNPDILTDDANKDLQSEQDEILGTAARGGKIRKRGRKPQKRKAEEGKEPEALSGRDLLKELNETEW